MNKINSNIVYDWYAKDPIKLDTVPLNKTYPEETVLLKIVYIYICISLGKSTEVKKDGQQILSGVKIRID